VSRYEFLLALHILGAIVWIGAAVSVQALAIRADRSGEPEQMRKIADDAEWLATRLFIPASLSVLILGILLVLDGPWKFSQTWILLGLAGYAFSFFVGLLFISPESGRIARLLGTAPPTPRCSGGSGASSTCRASSSSCSYSSSWTWSSSPACSSYSSSSISVAPPAT
jgi:uncharacterized membrane protein